MIAHLRSRSSASLPVPWDDHTPKNGIQKAHLCSGNIPGVWGQSPQFLPRGAREIRLTFLPVNKFLSFELLEWEKVGRAHLYIAAAT